MRSLSLWLFSLACLLVATSAIQLPDIEDSEEDEDVLKQLDEDDDAPIGRMLADLFEDEEIDEDDDDDEEVTGKQLAEVKGKEQDKYNVFMDTLLSQLERQAMRDLEPLKVTLTKPKKNKKNGKKNNKKKNKSRKDKKSDKKEDKVEKKKERNSRAMELSGIEYTEEDTHHIQKRRVEVKNKNKNRNNRKRQGRSNSKVVLHGLSHIKREGDVRLYNMKSGSRALLTDIVIGPIELDVTRKINDEEHKATASADKLNGKLMIKINKQGKPKVKKLSLGRPKDIKTTGSLAKDNGKGTGIFKKSVKQVAPTAAKKLLKAVKSIIQSDI